MRASMPTTRELRPYWACQMKLAVRTKLLGTAAILLAFGAVIAGVGYFELSGSNARLTTMYKDLLIGETQLSGMSQDALSIDSLVRQITSSTDSTVRGTFEIKIATYQADFGKQLQAAFAGDLDGLDAGILNAINTAHGTWSSTLETEVLAPARTGDVGASITAMSDVDPLYQAMLKSLTDATNMKMTSAEQYYADGQTAAGQANLILLVALLLGGLAGMALAIKLARDITGGVRKVQATLTSMTDNCATALEAGLAALSRNDLTVEVEAVTSPIENYGTDEIGQTAAVTNKMLAKLKATIESYEVARGSLAITVGEVKTAADALSRASDQLNSAATQSGSACSQVAQTIGQVAAGASDQARAANQTSNASHDLTAIIERVGEGAARTKVRVQDVSRALDATTDAIGRAMRDSDGIAPLNAQVDNALGAGAQAVDETALGMKRIKASVDATAARVTELGAKSDQIGAIVETIDDIAEQTNLLALNAAIEAARAGEQGKGFAVVADEVRKLAERSSRATKEIAALIAQVQQGTEAAVKAMAAGAGEVASGAELAEQAAGALEEIKQVAAARNLVLNDILGAVSEIRGLSTQVVAATEGIAVIASDTNAAAAQMGSASDVVAQSVESIAAISEENSASAEEVSAATEQMSAQAEEVVASASALSEMAQGLDELVSRFRIDTSSPATSGNVIPRRRASDWQASAARQADSA